MSTGKKKDNSQELSFEAALIELEKIVKAMEDPEISIEDLVAKHEEGKKLSEYCQKKLKAVELKIEKLKPGSKNELEPFGEE